MENKYYWLGEDEDEEGSYIESLQPETIDQTGENTFYKQVTANSQTSSLSSSSFH